jgi:Peptidase family M23
LTATVLHLRGTRAGIHRSAACPDAVRDPRAALIPRAAHAEGRSDERPCRPSRARRHLHGGWRHDDSGCRRRGDTDVDGNRTLSGCGWYAEIQHAGGWVTRYCHMVRRPSVTVGQTVTEGQVIGYVGTSGSSSGPHLHFEVHSAAPATQANAQNPVPFMRARGVIIR